MTFLRPGNDEKKCELVRMPHCHLDRRFAGHGNEYVLRQIVKLAGGKLEDYHTPIMTFQTRHP